MFELKTPQQYIFFLGNGVNQITGNKLFSNRNYFVILFYNTHIVNLNLSGNLGLVADECLLLWKKAKIPTQYHCNIV